MKNATTTTIYDFFNKEFDFDVEVHLFDIIKITSLPICQYQHRCNHFFIFYSCFWQC